MPISYSKNAKKHTAEQIYKIALSVKNFGWRQSIVVDASDIIIVGHGRWLCWENYGIELDLPEPWIVNEKGETIRGKQADWPLNEEQAKAYRLADNLLSSTDYDMDIVVNEMLQLAMPFQEMLKFDNQSTEKEDTQDEEVITDDAMMAYLNNSIRQMVLHYEQAEFTKLLDKVEALQNMLHCETTSDLFLKLVNESYANNQS